MFSVQMDVCVRVSRCNLRSSSQDCHKNYHHRYITGGHPVGGPGSVVGIAIGYGMNGPGIESRWGARFSAPVQTGPGPTQPPVQCVPGPGCKERPGRDSDPSTPSSALVKKG